MKFDKEKLSIIDEAYHACMNNNATPEQELIWQFANALHCARTRLICNDMKRARKIVEDYDYVKAERELNKTEVDYDI